MAVVAVAGALAAAGCGRGSEASFEDQAARACAQPGDVAGTATATAKATRAALARLRDLVAPDGQEDAAKALIGALTEQQRRLDRLAIGLRAHVAPAELRELTGAVDAQGNLVEPVAQRLGAPACGTAAARLADRLQAEDYSVAMHRTFDLLARADGDLPGFAAHDHAQLSAAADQAYNLMGDISGRLQDLEPPKAVTALHTDLVDATYELPSPFATIRDRAEAGGAVNGPALLAVYHRRLQRMRTLWGRIEARVPEVAAAGSRWGSPSAAREVAALRRKAYKTQLDLALAELGRTSLPKSYNKPTAWARVARAVDRVRSAARSLRPPTAAARAHRLLLAGLRDLRDGVAAVVPAIRAQSDGMLARARADARAGLSELRRAQRRFDAAGLDLDLGVEGDRGTSA